MVYVNGTLISKVERLAEFFKPTKSQSLPFDSEEWWNIFRTVNRDNHRDGVVDEKQMNI